jgi:3-mercaptopropionate dioxygenase
VVGVYRGIERETQFSEELVPVRTVYARAGHVEVLVPPEPNIHRVEAAGTEKTISIHVYGADIERLGTSILRRSDATTPRQAVQHVG